MATTQPTGPGPSNTALTLSGNYGGTGTWYQPYNYPYYYWPTVVNTNPSITRFRGSVRRVSDLPDGGSLNDQAKIGDAYFVKEDDSLVVRMERGWFTFDGPGQRAR